MSDTEDAGNGGRSHGENCGEVADTTGAQQISDLPPTDDRRTRVKHGRTQVCGKIRIKMRHTTTSIGGNVHWESFVGRFMFVDENR